MKKLPMKQASDLADSMAKHGLSGSIMMGSKMPKKSMSDMMPKDSMPDDEMHEPDQDKSEMDMCIADCADAMMSGDKDKMMSALHDLVDCIKSDDEMQDESDME